MSSHSLKSNVREDCLYLPWFVCCMQLSYWFTFNISCVISVFCHEATENCALLRYYTANSGNILINYIITLFNNQSLNLTASFANIKTPLQVLHYKQFLNLTFRGPCIVTYSYNKNRQDALFLNFILVKNFTCFGQKYCPSSGVLILYSQQLVSY